MRQAAPIFLPLSEPSASVASTSFSADAQELGGVGGAEQLRAAPPAGGAAARARRRGRGALAQHPPGCGHLLAHRQAGAKLRRGAGRAAAFALAQALGHLELHVVVEIADRRHARALVNGLLDFRRQRDVLDDEAGDLEAVFGRHGRVDQRQQRLAQLLVARRDVQHRHLRGGQRVAEHADDPRAHGVGELVEPEMVVGAGDLPQEELRVHDTEIESAVGPHPHDAEVGVAHHDRDWPCPTCCR